MADLSVPEVARRYNVSKQTVYSQAQRGYFPNAYKVGFFWRIPESDLVNFDPIPLHDDEKRFWAKVNKDSGYIAPHMDTECWIWTRYMVAWGYGRMYDNSKKRGIPASRFSWELHYGAIPSGLFVCHHCDNPSCIRPDHLFLGTPNDNIQDMITKGRAQYPGAKKPHINSPLTEDDVRFIRAHYPKHMTSLELADKFGLRRSTITAIARGDKWKHIS